MLRPEIAWKILALRCSEAARISSESLDRNVPAHERLAARLHGLVCSSCRRYRRQLLTLREVSQRLAEQVDPPGGLPLPDDVRDQIKRSLRHD